MARLPKWPYMRVFDMSPEICRKCFKMMHVDCRLQLHPVAGLLLRIDQHRNMKRTGGGYNFCTVVVDFDGIYKDNEKMEIDDILPRLKLTNVLPCRYFLEHYMHDIYFNKVQNEGVT